MLAYNTGGLGSDHPNYEEINKTKGSKGQECASEGSKSSWAAVASAKNRDGSKSLTSPLSICEVERALDQESGTLNSVPECAIS